MQPDKFKAIVLRQVGTDVFSEIETLSHSDLPSGGVLIRTFSSSLNYKDGLAICGKGRIVKEFPMVPGIDLAGTVETSASDLYKPGDRVVVTGWGIGEQHWGGLSEKARVSASWITPLIAGMSFNQAMGFGTAGLTAMLCADALERNCVDATKPILVTGAAGGVGSIAVAILAKLGYTVSASTGRPELAPYLTMLGATEIIDRAELAAPSKPLLRERWGGVVDTVGSQTLATALASTAYGGAVTACGLAGGADLATTVMPFILRGVALIGVDSVRCPYALRMKMWERLHLLFPNGLPAEMVEHVSLADIPAKAAEILGGQIRGRVVVDLS